jgi:hypothetical protein
MALETKNSDKVTALIPAQTQQKSEEAKVININPKDDDMGLKFLDKEFAYECMSIPTKSEMEKRLVVFIMLFCQRNHIKYEFDTYGNIYLTKGELEEGEYYPCVTSHLDSVQTKHGPYVLCGLPLDLVTTREKGGTHKVSVDGMGVGADDKGGVCISLSMFNHQPKLKACFFLEEEIGCVGSGQLNKDWFNDVGYVIGYDSPELNRAAWACSGTKLFNYEFYTKHMKKVCDKWGLTRFESEPFTDVKKIREATQLICMNFGNGGYLAHSDTEYFIMEDMDHALGMGKELIDELGYVRYTLSNTTQYSAAQVTFKSSNGENYNVANYVDSQSLEKLGKWHYSSGQQWSGGLNKSTSSYGQSNTVNKKREDEIKYETLSYVVKRYEQHITALQGEILDCVKEICKDNTIDFGLFEEEIKKRFDTEIVF